MNVNVTRAGGRFSVILPDEVAEELGAVDGGTLSLEAVEGGYRLVPAAPRPEVMALYEQSHEDYAPLYKKLAE